MPWSVGDVDKHKKGLSPKQKERWVAAANAHLKKCEADGGKDCEASAIRVANTVVTNEATTYAIHIPNEGYTIRREQHQGRAHIVVPVVMLVEGVLNGSHGPLLHEESEFGKYPEAWNGIPVVVYHPKRNGQNVSANIPEVIEKEIVGRTYNTMSEGKKLKAEAWLDEERLRTISPVAMQAILEQVPLDVSVGVFNDEEGDPGEYAREDGTMLSYEAIAKNHRPDHLALLPGGKGACSWEDGCGIRLNEATIIDQGGKGSGNFGHSGRPGEKGGSGDGSNADQAKAHQEKKSWKASVDKAVKDGILNENDKDDLMYISKLVEKGNYSLAKKEIGNLDTLVREYAPKVPKGEHYFNGTKWVYHAYEENNNPTEGTDNNSANLINEEVNNMSDVVKCTPCVEKKVAQLIANSQGRLTEKDDKEWLQTLEEAHLDKLIAEQRTIESAKKEGEPVQVLSDEDKADIAWARSERKARRAMMSKAIQDNTEKGLWSDDKLNSLDEETLKLVFNSVNKEKSLAGDGTVDYSAMAGAQLQVNQGAGVPEPMGPAGVVLK